MRLHEAKKGFGPYVVAALQPEYGGYTDRFSRRTLLWEFSRRGSFFFHFGAMPGYFERQKWTKGGEAFYNKYFPVLGLYDKPKINPDWVKYFTEFLEDLKEMNLMPCVYLFGGCDFKRPLSITDRTHSGAINIYLQAVVSLLKNCGQDYIIFIGNELYAQYPNTQESALAQTKVVDTLHMLGVSYGQIRYSALDKVVRNEKGEALTTQAEFIQVAAYKQHSDPNNQYRKFNVGIELHEIGSRPGTTDFDRDGFAGRTSVNGYANVNLGEWNNPHYSTDGARPEGGKYKGVSVEQLKQLYRRALVDFNHPKIGTCPLFEDLDNTAIKWSTVNGHEISTVVFGKDNFKRIDAMADVYFEVEGKQPLNKEFPPAKPTKPEKPKPEPTPEPTPNPEPKPKPEEPKVEKEFKFFSCKKSFPWISLDFVGLFKKWWNDFKKKSLKDKIFVLSILCNVVSLLIWIL